MHLTQADEVQSSDIAKEFVVKFGDGESSVIKNRGKSVHVYTDGHRMGKRPLLPYETRGKVAGVRISQGTERPFIFADIRTTGTDYPPITNLSYLLYALGLSRWRYNTWRYPCKTRRDRNHLCFGLSGREPATLQPQRKQEVQYSRPPTSSDRRTGEKGRRALCLVSLWSFLKP